MAKGNRTHRPAVISPFTIDGKCRRELLYSRQTIFGVGSCRLEDSTVIVALEIKYSQGSNNGLRWSINFPLLKTSEQHDSA